MGVDYSGGHVIVVAAIDRRVRAAVAQVPLISGWRNVLRLVRADLVAQFRGMFDADREARYEAKVPAMVPVVNDDPLGPAALPTPDSFEWFTETGRRVYGMAQRGDPALGRVLTEYEPGSYIDRVSPTPLLMLVGATDHLTVADEALAAFNRACEPKKLVLLPGGHFDAYTNDFDMAAGEAADWFAQHLARSPTRKSRARPIDMPFRPRSDASRAVIRYRRSVAPLVRQRRADGNIDPASGAGVGA